MAIRVAQSFTIKPEKKLKAKIQQRCNAGDLCVILLHDLKLTFCDSLSLTTFAEVV